MVIMVPLVVLTIYYGVHPAPVINASMAAVDGISKATQVTAQGASTTKTAAILAP